mgnify:CR=1 FL=1
MKYEEFLEKIKEIVGEYSYRDGGGLKLTKYEGRGYAAKEYDCPHLFVQWETGGVSGGSCWDSSNPQPYTTSNPEGELQCLDKILEYFVPNLSFLQYRILYNSLVERESRTEYEYYGNSTDYSYKEVDIKKLFDYMVGKEWLK